MNFLPILKRSGAKLMIIASSLISMAHASSSPTGGLPDVGIFHPGLFAKTQGSTPYEGWGRQWGFLNALPATMYLNQPLGRCPGPVWLHGTGDTTAVTVMDGGALSIVPDSAGLNQAIYDCDINQGKACHDFRFFFNEKLPKQSGPDSGVICTFGKQSLGREYQLCYRGNGISDSLYIRRVQNGVPSPDTSEIFHSDTGIIRVASGTWQPFVVAMEIYYDPQLGPITGSYTNWRISVVSPQDPNCWLAIRFSATGYLQQYNGSIYFNNSVSDCGYQHYATLPTQPTPNIIGLGNSIANYFGWRISDSVTQSFPCIDKIIYCPPGDSSTAKIDQKTQVTSTTVISSGRETNASAYVGLDLHVAAGCDVFGGTLDMNAFDLSAKAGFKYNSQAENGNTYTWSKTIGTAFEAFGEDLVIAEERHINSYVIGRRLLNFITDQSASADTDKTKNCYYIRNIPLSVTDVQGYTVSQYLSKYRNDPNVMANFVNLYAKDTATGKLRSSYPYFGKVDNSSLMISSEVEQDGSTVSQACSTMTQKFSWGAGPTAEFSVYFWGVGGGASYETMFTSSNETDSTLDHETEISYSYLLGHKWDVIHTKIWDDALFGSRLYSVDSSISYTSGPCQPQTQKSVTFKYVLHKPAQITVGQPAHYTLDITNISPKGNDLLKTWKPKFSGFTVSTALSSLYNNKITFLPNDIEIPQDSTVAINIDISSVPDTSTLHIVANYGYDDKGFDKVGSDEITPNGQITLVKPGTQMASAKEFSITCYANGIEYYLPKALPVTLKVYDLKGKQVAFSSIAIQKSGRYTAKNVTGNLASGAYVCRFDAGEYHALRSFYLSR